VIGIEWLIITLAVTAVVAVGAPIIASGIRALLEETGDAIGSAGSGVPPTDYTGGLGRRQPDPFEGPKRFLQRLRWETAQLLAPLGPVVQRMPERPKLDLLNLGATGGLVAAGFLVLAISAGAPGGQVIALALMIAANASVALPFFGINFGDLWRRYSPKLMHRLEPVQDKARKIVGMLRRGVEKALSYLPPKAGRRLFLTAAGSLLVSAAALGSLLLVRGDGGGHRAPSAAVGAGGSSTVDAAWLEALAREWFTYDGLDSWLGRLEPYLAPGAAQALRRCVQEPPGAPIWRVMRTSILEGPRVEVLGPLRGLTYGALADRGGAVHHPGIRERYGVDLQPDDLGVRFTATIAREFAPEKMQLPGIEQLTRARVAVQFFIAGGRAVPDYGECGMGVAWV